jgi:hypothetical protein
MSKETTTNNDAAKKLTKELKSFHTAICRRYMNGTLSQETIDRCNQIPRWNWNIHDTCETLKLDEMIWSLIKTL